MKLELKYSYSGKDYIVNEPGDARVSFLVKRDDNHLLINLINRLPIIIKSFKVEKKFRFRIRKISLTVAWMKNPTTRLEEEET